MSLTPNQKPNRGDSMVFMTIPSLPRKEKRTSYFFPVQRLIPQGHALANGDLRHVDTV